MISHTGKTPRILLIAPRIRFILAILAATALITSGLVAIPGAADPAAPRRQTRSSARTPNRVLHGRNGKSTVPVKIPSRLRHRHQREGRCAYPAGLRLLGCASRCAFRTLSGHVRKDDKGDSSHITIIVRDVPSKADVLVQTSDPIWHYYTSRAAQSSGRRGS